MDLKDISLMDSILNDINLMQGDKNLEVEVHFNYPKDYGAQNNVEAIKSLTFNIKDYFFTKLANTPFLKILYNSKKKQKYISITENEKVPEEAEIFSTYINTSFFESISISINRKNMN